MDSFLLEINRKIIVCLDNNGFGSVAPYILDVTFDTYSYNGKYIKLIDDDLNYALTLEQKITFLLTAIKGCKAGYNEYANKCLNLLRNLLPNANFDLSGELNPKYRIDLSEGLWGEDGISNFIKSNPPGLNLLDIDTMRDFLCRGVIIWGNTSFKDVVEEAVSESMQILCKVSREADF